MTKTLDLRLSTSSADNGRLARVTATAYDGPGPGTSEVHETEVLTYWHTPTNGGTPYLVVEVDGDSPFKIVRHDSTVLDES